MLSLHSFGFDELKLDGCGAQLNMTRYAELMKNSGKNYTVENCHWGHCGTWKGSPDASSCPSRTWCPFNMYRTSTDMDVHEFDWMANLGTMRKYLESEPPLSQPGCWAYPDMLEVGNIINGTFEWNRAHFGAWCIVSAPLILGLDLTNRELVAPLIPLITNPEALAVNQLWAGHPGRLAFQYSPPSLRSTASRRRGAGPPEEGTVQVWTKPQPAGSTAVLIINTGSLPYTVNIKLSEIEAAYFSGSVYVRDIWARRELGKSKDSLEVTVPGTDSVFYLLKPASARVIEM